METTSRKPREDQRVRLTKQLLRAAFLALLEEKPIQNITVKELCQRAGINRGTFYLHYQDVYQLMELLQAELLAELEGLLANNLVISYAVPAEVSKAFISAVFAFVEKNRDLCGVLLGPRGDKQLLEAIIASGREKSVREYCQMYPGLGREKAEVFFDFVAWGFIGLIQRGLQPAQNGATFAQVAQDVERIVMAATAFLETN